MSWRTSVTWQNEFPRGIRRGQSPELFKTHLAKSPRMCWLKGPSLSCSAMKKMILIGFFSPRLTFSLDRISLAHTEISYIRPLLSCGKIHQKLEQKQGNKILKNPFFGYQETPWAQGSKINAVLACSWFCDQRKKFSENRRIRSANIFDTVPCIMKFLFSS